MLGDVFLEVAIGNLCHGWRFAGLRPAFRRVLFVCHLSQQPLCFFAGSVRRHRPMLANGDAAAPPLAPTEAVLDEVNSLPCRRHLEAEARKLAVPEVGVALARLEGVNAPLGNFALCHVLALSCLLKASGKHIVSTLGGNFKTVEETQGQESLVLY